MELKGQEGSLGYNNPIFRESSETLDRRHLQQNPSTMAQPKRPDQLNGGGEGIVQKSSGSSLKAAFPAPASGTRYRECLKNHAASVGGNVLDGCGEFMPGGEDGTLEALKCAACNCHRNFHRKEIAGGVEADFARSIMVHPLQLPPPLPSPSFKHHHRISAGMHSPHHWTPTIPPVKMVFSGGGGGGLLGNESSSEDLNFNAFQSNNAATAPPPPPPPPPPPFALSKKRFRTKFTQEQKEKMSEYAEKVGWRIPREDDAELQRFCIELGVKRQVLKVWMHNNKNPNKKPHQDGQPQEEDS
ncbi:hypothetical protein U1Q18_005827 [Sarracenia purpurea var. burkii]